MKKSILTLLYFLPLIAYSQCAETTKTEILLVGDSWAFFMNVDGTINNIAKDWGHSNVNYYTNLTLSENGAETDDFLKPGKITELQSKLTSYTDLKAVHLSIGGNDFLGDWKVSFTQTQIDALYEGVAKRMDTIIDIIHTTRPDVHIFWSGYVYTNFKEVIEGTGILQTQHPFYSRWQSMEFPDFEQINTVQNYFQNQIQQRYINDPLFTYIPASAMMQYAFGQSTNLSVAPGGSYPAFSVPLPYGKTDYPSPKNTMRDYGITKDCFHLSKNGYEAFVSYHFQKFYHKLLMHDAYSVATFSNSGSVNNNGNLNPSLKVGKNGTEEYVSILNFDNSHFADSSIENASVFLKIDAITNSNFLTSGEFTAEIINGHFGSSSSIGSDDFSSSADAIGIPCVFGSSSQGKWARLDLPSSFLSSITNGTTQLRIKYTGTADGVIQFSNVSDTDDFQPVLDVTYQPTLGISSKEIISLKIYPNPASSLLTIDANQAVDEVFIYSVEGQLLYHEKHPVSTSINIHHLAKGLYILKVKCGVAMKTLKFAKE